MKPPFFPLKNIRVRQRGAALIIVVFFFIAVSLAIIQSATMGAIVELRTYRTLATSKFAYAAAEAGIEDMYYRTITNRAVPTSEIITLNNATSTVLGVAVSATQQDFYATGQAGSQVRKLYFSSSKNKTVPLLYGAQVGEGGVKMSNNSKIDGTGLAKGDLYSNGSIEGDENILITGNAISAAQMSEDMYASSTSCTNDETVGRTNPNIDYIQGFQMSGTTSAPLAKVALYIKRNGNVTGGTIRIVGTDASGYPDTTALASQALSYSSVSTSYGWVYIPFSSPATLNPDTIYWIIFDSTQSSSKYWTWCRSNSNTYAAGSPAYKQDWTSSGAGTAVSGDMTFTLTFGSGSSEIEEATISGIAKADSIQESTITGDAYYQTISGSTVAGTSYAGSPTPPPVPLPISSSTIAQWKADAALGGTINGNCGPGGAAECDTFPLTLGPKKINGNLQLGNNEALTVSGTLYVTGSVGISNGANVQCALAYLVSSCMIIADGSIDVSNNGILAGSGTSGSYIMLLTTITNCYSGASGGSGCASSNSGINVGNNVSGALFYSTDSMIQISNGATVTAVVGYMLSLSNNAQIIYNSDVANLSFSPAAASSTGVWNANRWNEY